MPGTVVGVASERDANDALGAHLDLQLPTIEIQNRYVGSRDRHPRAHVDGRAHAECREGGADLAPMIGPVVQHLRGRSAPPVRRALLPRQLA